MLRELKPLLHLDCLTVAGTTLGEVLEKQHPWVDRAVVKPFGEPLAKEGGLVALFGSLAPNGAILKRSAADPSLFEREGRAVVFSSLDDMAARVDDPSLDIKAEDFMVICPESAMPNTTDPAAPQVSGMVRISDAHERHHGRRAARIAGIGIGGPLALVRHRIPFRSRKEDRSPRAGE